MAIETVSFPSWDPVTGFPKIDGWTGNVDPGVITTQAEAGFAPGGRIAWGAGVEFPPVAFQCVYADVKATMNLPVTPGKYIVLGIFCTYDYSFDDEDCIVICFAEGPTGTDHTEARRLDIFPLTEGIGAGSAMEMENNPLLENSAPNNYHVRMARSVPNVNYWQGNSDGTWTSMAVTDANFHRKAASWIPSGATTKTPKVGSQVLSSATPSSFQVTNAGKFPSSPGLFTVVGAAATVAYTGKTGNTLEGCTLMPPGTPDVTVGPDSSIQITDNSWSIEILIPAEAALGAPNNAWIDLKGQFRMYSNLLRWTGPPDDHVAAQYRFPIPDPIGDDPRLLTGALDNDTKIPLEWYGIAEVPAITGTNSTLGVRFQTPNQPVSSVGVRHPSSGNTLTSKLYGPAGTEDNVLVAKIANNDPAHKWTGVTAEFRFADWGIPAPDWGAWDPADAHDADPSTSVSLLAGNTIAEITADWLHGNVPKQFAGNNGHHCMWVRLDTDGSGPVNFAQSGARRNMDFVQLSDHEAVATISGRGYRKPPSGVHQLVLFPHIRLMDSGRRRQGERPSRGFKAEQVWMWFVEGFLKTGETIRIGRQTAEVLDPTPGEFGLVATHAVLTDVLHFELEAPGLRQVGRGYEIDVPYDGEVRIVTRLRASPDREGFRPRKSNGRDSGA
jgi:hypothetical protein